MTNIGYMTSGVFDWRSRDRFAQFSRSEYYTAELEALTEGEALEIRVDKGLDFPYLVGATSAKTPYVYRRTRKHIETDRADICILHMMRAGKVEVSHRGKRAWAGPGQFFMIRSDAPFELKYQPGEEVERVMTYISLPPDIISEYFSDDIYGQIITPPDEYSHVAHDLFAMLFEKGGDISAEVARMLISTLLQEITTIPRCDDSEFQTELSVQDYRLRKIYSYLELHFTNPDLTTHMLAAACQISPRYLSHLLGRRGTSFSEILWDLRVEKVRSWLEMPALAHILVRTLAYRAGFKSASHFGHMFKARHGCTPREYRHRFLARGGDAIADGAAPEYLSG